MRAYVLAVLVLGAPLAARAGVAELRQACYGGRVGRTLPAEAVRIRERQIAAALAHHDAERVFRLTRRLLQGGADERRLLPGFVAAIEGRGGAEGETLARSCTELAHALEHAGGTR